MYKTLTTVLLLGIYLVSCGEKRNSNATELKDDGLSKPNVLCSARFNDGVDSKTFEVTEFDQWVSMDFHGATMRAWIAPSGAINSEIKAEGISSLNTIPHWLSIDTVGTPLAELHLKIRDSHYKLRCVNSRFPL